VDGQVAFTGGMNIGDEYLGQVHRLGFWRDTHLRLRGPCVLQLQAIFAEDWYYATGEELTNPGLFPAPEEVGTMLAQVIDGEPRGAYDAFHSVFFAAITEARKEILLTTSYFVPPPALSVALETAALRGVRVRLLLPSRAAHRWTVWAARSYYQSLLECGVEIFEYQRGQLHSKVLIVDGHWSLVGTPNFDARSLELNFEVGVAVYDRRAADLLADQFEQDLEYADKIALDDWIKRPKRTVLIQNFCRLFSPVL
jgi:cardiolipin synthase